MGTELRPKTDREPCSKILKKVPQQLKIFFKENLGWKKKPKVSFKFEKSAAAAFPHFFPEKSETIWIWHFGSKQDFLKKTRKRLSLLKKKLENGWKL